MRHADIAIVVANPEISSVRDSDRIIGLLDAKTLKAEKGGRIEKHLLITRYDAARAVRGEMMTIEDVLELLSIPLLGIIPESPEVLHASNKTEAKTHMDWGDKVRCIRIIMRFWSTTENDERFRTGNDSDHTA